MSSPRPGLSAEDFDAIEDAVMETVRGRWFLAEYARRNRAAEMSQMADAINALEQSLRGARPPALEQEGGLQNRLLGPRTKDIAEKLQDLAWNLRALGHDEEDCEELEGQARAVLGLTGAGETQGTVVPSALALPAFTPPPSIPKPVPDFAALYALEALPVADQLKIFA